jgi:exodeoxyribonuclease VII large subunit
MLVQAYGQVTVYEARGQYQLVVQLVQAKGQGLLQARFEALKKKLQLEGLFDRKRPLPSFPRRVGLITSPTGAAVQDMLNILQRRSPWLTILICPVRVQGEGAAEEIAEMIDRINATATKPPLDVLIVGRGGGSLEDLWPFNEEIVARAIFRSRLPIVSAVGHEIDFTIADFVADLRAPTPSAAAEIVAPDIAALTDDLRSRLAVLSRLIRQALEVRRLRLARLANASYLKEPRRLLAERQQNVDQLEMRLVHLRKAAIEQRRARIEKLTAILSAFRPDRLFEHKRRELISLNGRLRQACLAKLAQQTNRVAELGKMMRVHPGDKLRTRLLDGEVGVTVNS